MNWDNILNLIDHNPSAHFVDLGCDTGEGIENIGKRLGSSNTNSVGVEIVKEHADIARQKGIEVRDFNLNGKFDLPTANFDVAHANQVIEHLTDSDTFVKEVLRILKPGGYAIISTENASSWCNIFASLMGWQIFSLTNFSSLAAGIGNPLALHRDNERLALDSWNHVRIYNVWGLADYFRKAGFVVDKVVGAGYFPLPATLGRLDTTHSHFIAFKIRKP